jgi:hypothetical protein
LDLNSINSPAEYEVLSYAQKKDNPTISDITYRLHLPPADYDLYMKENAITLTPTEDTTVGVQAKINSGSVPEIHLSKAEIEHPGISLNFISDKIYLSPAGAVPASLRVEVLENASIGEHIIPIYGTPNYYSQKLEPSYNSERVNLSIIVQDKLDWEE